MLTQATTINDVRPGEGLEQKYGYLPEDGTYGCCNAHGVIATQLEDDKADFALSNFAQALGDSKDAAMLEARANNWENVFDPDNDLLTARFENGQFEQGIVPTTQQNNEPDYVEGDAYEYLWDTPDNYQTLVNLLGGNAKVDPALEAYLSQPNGNGMFDEIANEFDLGEQFGLDYAGDPAGTQAAVRNIENTVYLPGPSGLANNDDLGAESSSYLWQMLGLYPENPGNDTLLLNSPGFPHAQITLSNGHTITINAPDANNEYYVSSLKINGRPDQKLYRAYSDLSKGATLDWTLSRRPPAGAARRKTRRRPTPRASRRQWATWRTRPPRSRRVSPPAHDRRQQRHYGPQKVKVQITAPSGVTASLAGGGHQRPARRAGHRDADRAREPVGQPDVLHHPGHANRGRDHAPDGGRDRAPGRRRSSAGHPGHHPGDPATGCASPGGAGQQHRYVLDGDGGQLDAGEPVGHPGTRHHHCPPVVDDRVGGRGRPDSGQAYPFTVTSVLSNGLRSAPLSGHVSFLPVVERSLGSSWSLSDVEDGPSVDLGDWGAAGSAQAPAGLSGKVWFDWDSSDLYVTAEVTDGNFSAPAYRGEHLAGRQPAGGGHLGGAGVVGRGERRVDGRALRVRGGADFAGRSGVPVDRSGWGGDRAGGLTPRSV